MAAGDAVLVGVDDFVLTGRNRVHRAGRGWVTEYIYEGPPSKREIKEAALIADGLTELRVRVGTPTQIIAAAADEEENEADELEAAENESEWSLEPYDLGKALGTHGKFQESGASAETLALIDSAIADGTASLTDWDTVYPGLGEMNAYSELRAMGVTEWTAFGFRLRKTMLLNRESGAVPLVLQASALQGRIMSWDAIEVPLRTGIEKPWIHIFLGTASGSPPAAAVKAGEQPGWMDIYIDQWMKVPPSLTYRQVGKVRKREIRMEWVGAVQWSGTLYDGGTGSP